MQMTFGSSLPSIQQWLSWNCMVIGSELTMPWQWFTDRIHWNVLNFICCPPITQTLSSNWTPHGMSAIAQLNYNNSLIELIAQFRAIKINEERETIQRLHLTVNNRLTRIHHHGHNNQSKCQSYSKHRIPRHTTTHTPTQTHTDQTTLRTTSSSIKWWLNFAKQFNLKHKDQSPLVQKVWNKEIHLKKLTFRKTTNWMKECDQYELIPTNLYGERQMI